MYICGQTDDRGFNVNLIKSAYRSYYKWINVSVSQCTSVCVQRHNEVMLTCVSKSVNNKQQTSL